MDTSGILLLDKSPGITSFKAMQQAQRKLGIKKAGHAGTLDPDATGLLVILFGQATKMASSAGQGNKRYSGTIRFGIRTSTDDIAGEIIESSDKLPSIDEVRALLPRFEGTFQQVPPQVSAVKIDGRRAYKRVREGEVVKIEPRQVTVSWLALEKQDGDFFFEVETSKGCYVRALARDLGDTFGCGAALASLRRTYSAPFSVKDARTLDEISMDDILSTDCLISNGE